MAIAALKKVELVAPKTEIVDLLKSLKQAALLHVEDVHVGLAEEMSEWEQPQIPDTSVVDSSLSAARWILDLFQRFESDKKSMLEDFFGSPPVISDEEFLRLVDSVDVSSYRTDLERHLADFDGAISKLHELHEQMNLLVPWKGMDVELASVGQGSYVALTAVKVPNGNISELQDLLIEIGDHVRLVVIGKLEKTGHVVIVSLPEEVERVESFLRRVRGEHIELPDLHQSPLEALNSAHSEVLELEQTCQEKRDFFVKEARLNRSAVLAVIDDQEGRRQNMETLQSVFYSRHVGVIVGWTEETQCSSLEDLLGDLHPHVRYRFTVPNKNDQPPVKLKNRKLIQPFQTLISMYGMPNYFGIDPTPFVAMAMTVFYAMALGDFGYGVLQILLASWLIRKFKSTGETRLFLTMFVYMGWATLIVGVLTWSFFGFSPGTDPNTETKIFGVLPLINPTRDIIPLIGVAVGIGIFFQLASITAGFINLLKLGDWRGAFFDNLAWFLLLLGGLLLVGGIFLNNTIITTVGVIGAGIGATTIVVFAGRGNKNILARILTGVVSLYGIIGYYGIVGFFSDALSYMRLAILNMTSAFIAFVAQVIGGLFIGGDGSIIMMGIAVTVGSLVFIFFHLLNLVLSMLGAFVHSLRLNYLESFQRYYPDGGRAFRPFQRTGRFFRRTGVE